MWLISSMTYFNQTFFEYNLLFLFRGVNLNVHIYGVVAQLVTSNK